MLVQLQELGVEEQVLHPGIEEVLQQEKVEELEVQPVLATEEQEEEQRS